MLHVIESRASCGTIREYGRECLEETGEAAALQRQHATYYLALALDAELAVTAAAQAVWLTRLEDEDGNLRAALQWAQESGDTATGLRLAGALRRFWVLHGYLSEVRAWLAWFLTRGGRAAIAVSVPAEALPAADIVTANVGDDGRVTALPEESPTLRRELEDQPGIAATLGNLGNMAKAKCLLPTGCSPGGARGASPRPWR